jgi:AcrR family transcriptional regulator
MARNAAAFKNKTLDEKRDMMIAAAWKLFEQFGFRRVSMDDIAKAVGVSKGAIYLYFKSKEEIFIAVTESNLRAPLEAARRAAAEPGGLEARLVNVLMSKIGIQYSSLYQSKAASELIEAAYHVAAESIDADFKAFHKLLASIFNDSIDAGEIALKPLGLSASEVAYLFIESSHGIARVGEKLVAPATYKKRLKNLVAIMVRGLRP